MNQGWGPQPYPGQPFGYAHGVCVRCGQPNPDHFLIPTQPLHRACAGLGPDVLPWPWLLLAYGLTIPFGCSFIGALFASVPYYMWKNTYPNKAKTYNRHVWIGFAISCAFYILFFVLSKR